MIEVEKEKSLKIVMAMVMSVDGKTTMWDDPEIYKWTSKEDQAYFFSLIKKYRLILMGQKTYSAAKSIIKPSPEKLRMILTNSPQKYLDQTIPNQIEFSSLPPERLVSMLENREYKEALLVGGAETNASFLKAKQVSEIWVTVEPRLFGSGKNLISNDQFDIPLELTSTKKLNKTGTLLLKYKITR